MPCILLYTETLEITPHTRRHYSVQAKTAGTKGKKSPHPIAHEDTVNYEGRQVVTISYWN